MPEKSSTSSYLWLQAHGWDYAYTLSYPPLKGCGDFVLPAMANWKNNCGRPLKNG